MKEYLNKFVYLHLEISNQDTAVKHLYYLCAYVINIDDNHITFLDDNGELNTKKREDISEIKLSYKTPKYNLNEKLKELKNAE